MKLHSRNKNKEDKIPKPKKLIGFSKKEKAFKLPKPIKEKAVKPKSSKPTKRGLNLPSLRRNRDENNLAKTDLVAKPKTVLSDYELKAVVPVFDMCPSILAMRLVEKKENIVESTNSLDVASDFNLLIPNEIRLEGDLSLLDKIIEETSETDKINSDENDSVLNETIEDSKEEILKVEEEIKEDTFEASVSAKTDSEEEVVIVADQKLEEKDQQVLDDPSLSENIFIEEPSVEIDVEKVNNDGSLLVEQEDVSSETEAVLHWQEVSSEMETELETKEEPVTEPIIEEKTDAYEDGTILEVNVTGTKIDVNLDNLRRD